jgi:uncharacterized repeat protein (TIGR01451 family)
MIRATLHRPPRRPSPRTRAWPRGAALAGAVCLGLLLTAGLAAAQTGARSIVGLTDTPSSDTVVAGQTVTFTLEITNDNGRALTNVRTCNRLPSRLIFVSATPAARLSVGRYCWTVSRLSNGQTRTFKLTAQVPLGPGGAVTNTATATANAAALTRTTTRIEITAKAAVACPASARGGPTAHAAC